jgi:hypothetical protein
MGVLVLNFLSKYLTFGVGDFVVAITSLHIEGQTNMVFLHRMIV